MRPILERFHQGILAPYEFAAVYIVTVLAYRYPGDWLGARRPSPLTSGDQLKTPLSSISELWEENIKRRTASFMTLGELFQYFAFKSTPASVNRSVLGWSSDEYGLELMFRIPRPAEVLGQQKQGRRCVTIILEKEKASKFILGERDALGFTMHDLIHADHFYFNNHCYQGQLGFYAFLDYCMNENHFDELLTIPKFESEFEYLISDMNAYAIHLMKCFKSALIHYHPKAEVFFEIWLERFSLDPEVKKALRDLNSPEYQGEQDVVLLSFLDSWRKV